LLFGWHLRSGMAMLHHGAVLMAADRELMVMLHHGVVLKLMDA